MSPRYESTVSEIERLRVHHYNSTVVKLEQVHADLIRIQVRPDCGPPSYLAGQYTVLGMGGWEPRLEGCQEEGDLGENRDKLIRRAYSISSPMLWDGKVIAASETEFLEFYVVLVRKADKPPALTPRLFCLQEGDRLFCGPRAHGRYTLHHIDRDAAVVFAATGTGEAPHNAMVAQLLKTGHRGPIINATCVRLKRDLGYLDIHRQLERMWPTYRYIALTTREPENLDPQHPGFVGKRYLQDYFTSAAFQEDCGLQLEPDNMHVFLCGNPSMIGAPVNTHADEHRYPHAGGLVETLERRGFQIDRAHDPGNIHYESYW